MLMWSVRSPINLIFEHWSEILRCSTMSWLMIICMFLTPPLSTAAIASKHHNVFKVQMILQVVGRPTAREDFPAVPASPPESSWCYAVEQGMTMYGSQFPNASIDNNKSANEEHWRIEGILESCSGGVAQLAMTQQCQHVADDPQ